MINRTDKLVEATILALQGKLELKENKRVSGKTKKSEGIDVNVDDKTTVSVEGNETIVDTEDATVIVNKKEDEFIPETSDDLPMEAPVEEPVVDAPVAPNEDIVEVPADDTVMPEEIVDEPVDTELPDENLGESKNIDNAEVKTINVKGLSNAWKIIKYKNKYYQLSNSEYEELMSDPDKFFNYYDINGYSTLKNLIDNAKNDAVLGPLSFKENKKLENVNIEVSDDGKEVEVTTDNGEEVEVKNETPDENEKGETENTETEIPADDAPSIDEMIEENKKVTEGARDIADHINNDEWFNNDKRKQTLRGMLADKIADVAESLGDDYSEWVSDMDFDDIINDIINSKEWEAFDEKLNEIIAEAVEDKVDWTRRDEPASKYYTGNPDLEESKKVEAQSSNIALDAVKWTFGLNNKEARDYIKANKDKIDNIVKGYLDNAKKNFYNEGKKVEDTEEYLEPRYDTRNSFYKKAKVVTKDNGDEELYSYGTHVGGVRAGKPYSKGKFSQTTSRHQKEFFKQRGVDPNKVDVEEGKHLKVKSLRKAEGIRAVEEYEYDFDDLYDIVGNNGKSVLDDIKKANKEEEFMDYVNSIMGEDTGRVPTVGEVSDFIDYDFETIFRDLEIKTEGKQADRNEEEINAKKSKCINCENKDRSKKVQEMIARRQKKLETKNDLGINEGTPKTEEEVPNTSEASLKVENKFSSKSFNEVLTKYYSNRILAVESVEVTKLSKTRQGLKLEANLINKRGNLKKAICLELKQIQTGKSFDKYELIETKGLVKENKSNNNKVTITTFKNKNNVIECRYILSK